MSPTADEDRIYLPLAGGRLVCLDLETGSLIWSSEPGGVIAGPVLAGGRHAYLATRLVDEEGIERRGVVRALEKGTGLTLWAREYDRPITSQMALDRGRILAGSEDGGFYAISAENGDLLWSASLGAVVRGRPLVTESVVFVGADDGSLHGLARESGEPVWLYRGSGAILGQPASDGRSIFFGSADGFVYSVDLAARKLNWRSRTGAAIAASPVLLRDRLIAASFDNFVYAMDRSTGNRIWKRRVENRAALDPIVAGDATMIAPLRSGYVAVFLTADGRLVNRFNLEKGYEIVAAPILMDERLLLATDRGLVVATSSASKEPLTP